MSIFRIEMLPAQQGDALLLEYGDAGQLNHVLIDAGTPSSYAAVKQRLRRLDQSHPHLELLIVSHIDTDHIGGVLKLFSDSTLDVLIDDVWFNSWEHLPGARSDRLGPVDGEILSTQLHDQKRPWNQAFDGHAVRLPDEGSPPVRSLPGGLTLTVLSPGRPQLTKLRQNWRAVTTAAGLDPAQPGGPAAAARRLADLAARKGIRLDRLGAPIIDTARLAQQPFEPDRTVANGSSIVVLAEYQGKSALLGADAFPSVVSASVRTLLSDRHQQKLHLDAVKLCHHGSKHNTNTELLSLLSCGRYLFSTNGNIFGHPDEEAVARVLVHGGGTPTLCFNYSSTINKVWADPAQQKQDDYQALFPAPASTGLAVEL